MSNIEAIRIEDKNIFIVNFTSGTYSIDGKIVEIDVYRLKNDKIQLNKIDDIRYVTTNSYVKGYEDAKKNKMSLEEYQAELKRLLSKGKRSTYLDDDGNENSSDTKFDNLDDEIEFIRFTKTWSIVKGVRQEISEPIQIPVVSNVTLDTKNPYVTSYFYLNGEVSKDSGLYRYNRGYAVVEITKSIFKSLGVEEKVDCSYEQTARQKIYGGIERGSIGYTKAFGHYVFSGTGYDDKNLSSQSGDLKSMLSLYEKDKEKLKDIIKSQYNLCFGKINCSGANYQRIAVLVDAADSLVGKIEYKANSRNKWVELRNTTSELKELITKTFAK